MYDNDAMKKIGKMLMVLTSPYMILGGLGYIVLFGPLQEMLYFILGGVGVLFLGLICPQELGWILSCMMTLCNNFQETRVRLLY